MKRIVRLTLSLLLVTSAGCSLVVDVSDVDEGCGPGGKVCGGVCVDQSDPAFGCGPTSCTPCLMPNAIPTCDGTECTIAACLYGFGCPQCDVNILSDANNCGECGKACDAGLSCSDRTCVED